MRTVTVVRGLRPAKDTRASTSRGAPRAAALCLSRVSKAMLDVASRARRTRRSPRRRPERDQGLHPSADACQPPRTPRGREDPTAGSLRVAANAAHADLVLGFPPSRRHGLSPKCVSPPAQGPVAQDRRPSVSGFPEAPGLRPGTDGYVAGPGRVAHAPAVGHLGDRRELPGGHCRAWSTVWA